MRVRLLQKKGGRSDRTTTPRPWPNLVEVPCTRHNVPEAEALVGHGVAPRRLKVQLTPCAAQQLVDDIVQRAALGHLCNGGAHNVVAHDVVRVVNGGHERLCLRVEDFRHEQGRGRQRSLGLHAPALNVADDQKGGERPTVGRTVQVAGLVRLVCENKDGVELFQPQLFQVLAADSVAWEGEEGGGGG